MIPTRMCAGWGRIICWLLGKYDSEQIEIMILSFSTINTQTTAELMERQFLKERSPEIDLPCFCHMWYSFLERRKLNVTCSINE